MPESSRLNYNDEIGHPTPVGLYPNGATPGGVQDMAGNVWERTTEHWRGGAYWNDENWVRAGFRLDNNVIYRDSGFRSVVSLPR